MLLTQSRHMKFLACSSDTTDKDDGVRYRAVEEAHLLTGAAAGIASLQATQSRKEAVCAKIAGKQMQKSLHAEGELHVRRPAASPASVGTDPHRNFSKLHGALGQLLPWFQNW